jgi:sugar (pentulose or hexulose) kinase
MPEPRTWLAFDLGAESGRAFTGRLERGILTIREIHRFSNEPVDYCGSLHWDAPRLWMEMRKALSLAGERLEGIGVDSWGVDYALLDEGGELLKNPYHYRDARNPRAMAEVLEMVSRENNLSEDRHTVFADQYALSAIRREMPNTRDPDRRKTAADDPGPFQLLAYRPRSL